MKQHRDYHSIPSPHRRRETTQKHFTHMLAKYSKPSNHQQSCPPRMDCGVSMAERTLFCFVKTRHATGVDR